MLSFKTKSLFQFPVMGEPFIKWSSFLSCEIGPTNKQHRFFLFGQLCFLSKQLWFLQRMSTNNVKCSRNVTNVTYTCPSLNRHLRIESSPDFYPSCHVTSWIAILDPKGSARITESCWESAKELLLNKVKHGINDKFGVMFKLIWQPLIKNVF
jgi:hypothetical protein